MMTSMSEIKNAFQATASLGKDYFTSCLPKCRGARDRAFTLVEVMIATALFTLVALSIGSLYVQNYQIATRLRYRTNATNAALNILEQIRVLDFNKLSDLYKVASAPSNVPAFIRVLITDPNAADHTHWDPPDPKDTTLAGFGTDIIPLRYQNLDLKINVLDDAETNSTWNVCSLPLQSSPTAPRMPMQFWLTLKYNTAVSGDNNVKATGEVFEIVIVYQWQQPATASTSTWASGTVRAVIHNPMPKVIGT